MVRLKPERLRCTRVHDRDDPTAKCGRFLARDGEGILCSGVRDVLRYSSAIGQTAVTWVAPARSAETVAMGLQISTRG
jgi:hypothetical protein